MSDELKRIVEITLSDPWLLVVVGLVFSVCGMFCIALVYGLIRKAAVAQDIAPMTVMGQRVQAETYTKHGPHETTIYTPIEDYAKVLAKRYVDIVAQGITDTCGIMLISAHGTYHLLKSEHTQNYHIRVGFRGEYNPFTGSEFATVDQLTNRIRKYLEELSSNLDRVGSVLSIHYFDDSLESEFRSVNTDDDDCFELVFTADIEFTHHQAQSSHKENLSHAEPG